MIDDTDDELRTSYCFQITWLNQYGIPISWHEMKQKRKSQHSERQGHKSVSLHVVMDTTVLTSQSWIWGIQHGLEDHSIINDRIRTQKMTHMNAICSIMIGWGYKHK